MLTWLLVVLVVIGAFVLIGVVGAALGCDGGGFLGFFLMLQATEAILRVAGMLIAGLLDNKG